MSTCHSILLQSSQCVPREVNQLTQRKPNFQTKSLSQHPYSISSSLSSHSLPPSKTHLLNPKNTHLAPNVSPNSSFFSPFPLLLNSLSLSQSTSNLNSEKKSISNTKSEKKTTLNYNSEKKWTSKSILNSSTDFSVHKSIVLSSQKDKKQVSLPENTQFSETENNRFREFLNFRRFRDFRNLEDFRTFEGFRNFGTGSVLATVPLILAVSVFLADPAMGVVGEWGELGKVGGGGGEISEFQSGFASSFLLILFSEIGDKTFFIAALLATRKPTLLVFIGTFGALVIMTLISVVLGRVFHVVDEAFPVTLGSSDLPLDDIAAVVLLVYFGVSTLRDAAAMETSKAEEEQQEAAVAVADVGSGSAMGVAVVGAVFTLVFAAEWGDKSFFATIALAAASSPLGVVAGAAAGHGAATLLAVLGGSFLGSFVSEKAVAYTGGALFLVFALVTSAEIFNKLT